MSEDATSPGHTDLMVTPESLDSFMDANSLGADQTPPCRVCGKTEWVACYREETPQKAICVECCGTAKHDDGETGHVWTYERAERDRVCDHCGQFARNTDYYDHWDEP